MAEGHQPRVIKWSRSLEAVGLAQCSSFGLQPLFFAVSLFARRQVFLTGHNGALQRRQKHCMYFILILDWHAVGWFHWPMWSADGCILIPSFSRETPCQKVINCKQAKRGVAAWTPWCKQNNMLLDIMCMDQRNGRV